MNLTAELDTSAGAGGPAGLWRMRIIDLDTNREVGSLLLPPDTRVVGFSEDGSRATIQYSNGAVQDVRTYI